MRSTLIIILGICFSFICKAQVDTSLNYLNESKLYVLDGILTPKEAIKSENILIRQVVSREDIYKMMSGVRPGLDSIIVIVTRQAAIKQYQEKLSSFSEKYKNYLETWHNNDEDFTYSLNKNLWIGRSDEVIKILYNIPKEKIIRVDFNEKLSAFADNKRLMITTK